MVEAMGLRMKSLGLEVWALRLMADGANQHALPHIPLRAFARSRVSSSPYIASSKKRLEASGLRAPGYGFGFRRWIWRSGGLWLGLKGMQAWGAGGLLRGSGGLGKYVNE